jgi:hypothetical protein
MRVISVNERFTECSFAAQFLSTYEVHAHPLARPRPLMQQCPNAAGEPTVGETVNVHLATQLATGGGTHMQPALPDIGVLALVPERWGGMWLSRHQISTRLSRYFNVVWHNPPYEWREWQRPVTQCDSTPPPADGFAVYDPEPWLPRFPRS